ncbi:MAG: hypothetical protein F6K48_05910 [Okeania sp. SIO3H1]|nr:hypothetical protein [Okeania sp. SIO3H1]
MTVTLERPMSPACDSTLASDIRHLIDSLDEKIYSIERDYQEIFCCEVILLDDRSQHWQLEIHDNGTIELLHQQYENDQLIDIGFCEINHLAQFIKAFVSDETWQQIKDIAYEKSEYYGQYEDSLARIAELAHLPAPSPGLPFIKVRALRDYAIAEVL